jgi:hypothetical protein
MTDSPPVSPVLQAAARYRAQLMAAEAQAVGRMVDAYRRSFSRLSDSVELLAERIASQGAPPTPAQIRRMEQYERLMQQVADELQGLTALTRNEIERAAELGIDLGGAHARGLMSYAATGGPQVAGAFGSLPRGAVEQLVGFLDPQGPLYARLRLLAPHTAGLVSDALVSGLALGHNPRKIAAIVQDAFGGGLTDSLRFTRTAQIWAYRESNRATYLANQDVVSGWVWSAELGPRTCASCFAMHGTIHPLSEPLRDHHAGRCSPLPIIRGQEPPITESGEAWFQRQPEAFQRQVLGPGRYDALREGKYKFGALSRVYNDRVYGDMFREATLQELVGGD